jgi:hypothetical protein
VFLRDYFDHFPKNRHNAVVSDSAVAGAAVLERLLPTVDVSSCIFECELYRPEVEGDYSLRITQGELSSWVSELRETAFRDWSAGAVPWERAREFLSRWATEPAFSKLGEFWLEFDYETLKMGYPKPCCFFGAETVQDPVELRHICAGPLSALLGRQTPDGLRDNLKRCIRALPLETGLFQIGVMLSRDETPESTRLFTGEMGAGQVVPFLRAAGWQGAEPVLEEFLKWSVSHSDGLYIVDFDVFAEKISSNVGVNFGVSPRDGALEAFLDAMRKHGFARGEKCAGVKKWLESDDIPQLTNNISHFKFPFDGYRVKGAKVYLRHEETPDVTKIWGRW